ncbi:MAG: GNAT family N-acetyltransferase [Victivallales bacterium]
MFELAGTVGWNQTLRDCREMILAPASAGIFAVHEGRVIGSAAAKIYEGDQMGYINMVIVREAYRRKGIASMMLKKLMELLKDCRTLRLYATKAGSYVYEKLGFKTYATLHKFGADDYRCLPERDRRVVPLLKEDLAEITALDRQSFGLERGTLLTYFYECHPELSFKIMDGQAITGFTIGRIGPVSRQANGLTAANEEDALSLFDAVARYGEPSPRILLVAFDSQTRLIELMAAKGILLQRSLSRWITESPVLSLPAATTASSAAISAEVQFSSFITVFILKSIFDSFWVSYPPVGFEAEECVSIFFSSQGLCPCRGPAASGCRWIAANPTVCTIRFRAFAIGLAF